MQIACYIDSAKQNFAECNCQLLLNRVAVEKLIFAKIAKIKLRQDAL